MAKIGDCRIPDDFQYEDTLAKGMPEHDEYFYMRHPHMPYGKRAKIFAPFAALRGFEEEVESKEVLYVRKKELDSDEYYELNGRLNLLHELTKTGKLSRANQVRAAVEYYVPCSDDHNEAYGKKGIYEIKEGVVRYVDRYEQKIRIDDDVISFADISRIEILSRT